MKVLIAIDSYKGCMSSYEAGCAAEQGVLAVYPEAETVVYRVADGGEGTLEALCQATASGDGFTSVDMVATGPLGEKIKTGYYIMKEKQMAVIEMSAAAGLTLIPFSARNPMYTTTYGVGEMIRDAILKGCRRFVVGIGGSATNDGGVGMLQALGFRFVDSGGRDISMGAKGLLELSDIYMEDVMPELSQCVFQVACDVRNPLLGDFGCSRVFAAQKGAGPAEIELLERGMTRYANLVEHIAMCCESDLHHVWRKNHERNTRGNKETNTGESREEKSIPGRDFPGAGAAGGLGFGFLMFLPSRLEPGVEIVLDEIGIEQDMKDADLVLTGEGCFDEQSLSGKTPIGVAERAKKYGREVYVFAGRTTHPETRLVDGSFFISEGETDLRHAMQKTVAMDNMRRTVEEFMRKYR